MRSEPREARSPCAWGSSHLPVARLRDAVARSHRLHHARDVLARYPRHAGGGGGENRGAGVHGPLLRPVWHRAEESVSSAGGAVHVSTRTDTAQELKSDPSFLLRRFSSESTSSLIASGSFSRCHWHSRSPAAAVSDGDAARRTALMAKSAAPSS